MIVSPASRMLSAISFGVFWRVGALDERDHPVEERLARLRRDPHDDLVREHTRAAGDRGAVATRLADHRRRLAGDRRLVDRRDALDDRRRRRGSARPRRTTHSSPTCRSLDDFSAIEPSGRRMRATVSARVLRSVSACALPRPSATASAKFANNTVNHSHAATRPVNTLSDDFADGSFWKNRTVVSTLPDLDDEHHRVAHHLARVELDDGVADVARRMIAGSNSERVPAGRVRTLARPRARPGRLGVAGLCGGHSHVTLAPRTCPRGARRRGRARGPGSR